MPPNPERHETLPIEEDSNIDNEDDKSIEPPVTLRIFWRANW